MQYIAIASYMLLITHFYSVGLRTSHISVVIMVVTQHFHLLLYRYLFSLELSFTLKLKGIWPLYESGSIYTFFLHSNLILQVAKKSAEYL